jgi:hypothetical protein
MTVPLLLRDVIEDNLLVFFEQQLDPEANHMAAFAAKDPAHHRPRWCRNARSRAGVPQEARRSRPRNNTA